MNCKPNQMEMVIHASKCEPCSARVLGLPTIVAHVAPPALQEVFEGPVWVLAEPFQCPFRRAGCGGIDRMPDACLRPFDPESVPEPAAADIQAGAPVEVA